MQRLPRDSHTSRWLGPGELARRLGISIKALRVYERAGLVAPGRRERGWRTYGPSDIARLHEVLALRSLGLSLAEVKQILDAPASSLRRTLEIQQRHLANQLAVAHRRLAAVNSARRRLEEEGGLDIDDLLALTSETTVTPSLSADQVEAIIYGHADEQEGDPDLTRFQRELRARVAKAGIRHSDFERSVSQLVADASLAARSLEPASDQGRALAERWIGLVALLGPTFGHGSDRLGEGVATFASALIDDPELSDALAFLREAVKAARTNLTSDSQ